jgi:hypothetical protein
MAFLGEGSIKIGALTPNIYCMWVSFPGFISAKGMEIPLSIAVSELMQSVNNAMKRFSCLLRAGW